MKTLEKGRDESRSASAERMKAKFFLKSVKNAEGPGEAENGVEARAQQVVNE